jgi:hypothetical protein
MGCTESLQSKDPGRTPATVGNGTPPRDQSIDRAQEKTNTSVSHPIISLPLLIEVEDDDDEEDFQVRRLISCPNLTPSITRSVTPHFDVQEMKFFNVTEASLEMSDSDFYNWAEHAPLNNDNKQPH